MNNDYDETMTQGLPVPEARQAIQWDTLDIDLWDLMDGLYAL